MTVVDIAQCQQKRKNETCVKDGRRSSFLHHPSEQCDLGRPKRRWKHHEHLQDQDKQGDLTPSVYDDGNDSK